MSTRRYLTIALLLSSLFIIGNLYGSFELGTKYNMIPAYNTFQNSPKSFNNPLYTKLISQSSELVFGDHPYTQHKLAADKNGNVVALYNNNYKQNLYFSAVRYFPIDTDLQSCNYYHYLSDHTSNNSTVLINNEGMGWHIWCIGNKKLCTQYFDLRSNYYGNVDAETVEEVGQGRFKAAANYNSSYGTYALIVFESGKKLYAKAYRNGGTWTGRIKISDVKLPGVHDNQNYLSVEMNDAGRGWVLFCDKKRTTLYARYFDLTKNVPNSDWGKCWEGTTNVSSTEGKGTYGTLKIAMNGKNGILAWIKQNPYKEDIHESLSLETRSTSGPHFEGSTVLREKEIVSYDITLLNKLIIACAKDPIFYKKEKTDIEILKNNNEILFKIFDKRPGETKLRVSPNKDVILLAYGDFPQRLDKTPSTNNKLKYCLYDIKTDKFIKEIVSIDESKCLSNFDISFANDNTLVFLYSVGGYNALPMFSDFRRLLITRIPIYKL